MSAHTTQSHEKILIGGRNFLEYTSFPSRAANLTIQVMRRFTTLKLHFDPSSLWKSSLTIKVLYESLHEEL